MSAGTHTQDDINSEWVGRIQEPVMAPGKKQTGKTRTIRYGKVKSREGFRGTEEISVMWLEAKQDGV